MSRRQSSAARRACCVGVAVLVLAACDASSISFTHDASVHITAPAPLEVVTVPFTVSWTTGSRSGGSYAVFVDRAPIAPGDSTNAVADDACRKVKGCPDATYLNSHGVYLTSSNSVQIRYLPAVGGVAGKSEHPAHHVVVVALDGRGRRVNGDSWTAEFRG